MARPSSRWHRLLLAATLLLAPLAAAAAAADLRLRVDGRAIVEQLLHLATFSDDPNPAVTRILFTGGCCAAVGRGGAGRAAHPHLSQTGGCAHAGLPTIDLHADAYMLTCLPACPHPAENDMRGRAYVKQLMREAGLAVREDTMGAPHGP